MPTPARVCNHFIVYTFYAYAVLGDVPSPWGPVRIAATDRGVVAVSLLATREAFESNLARRGIVADADRAGERARETLGAAMAAVARMIDEPTAGRVPDPGSDAPPDPASLPVDLGDRPAWDRLVLDAVRAIPRGEVVSYGEVARRIGRPGAARAVGGAVGRNPVGLLVPCHRVIAGDGSLGGYGVAAMGGREAALDLKRELLALEGVEIRR